MARVTAGLAVTMLHHVEHGITLAPASALPTAWVSDDHYRDQAHSSLARVQAHLE